jgi:ERCC4-related helicase
MQLTDYHAQYFAHELTKRCSSDKLEKLASTFAGARVDLNPHQVEAALFAFRSPLSKGALLADEVGLGKTIEAGLVIAQKWAERKRRILVITPASLRKQWLLELKEKFFLPGKILETKSYKQAKREGAYNPFDDKECIVFCSYQFARSKAKDVESTQWDLVVIDEAHRLRNVYKSSNVIAKQLREILKKRNKLLLTATPLQNSLLELYGLVSFIDELTFGDVKSFKEQFTGRQNSSDMFEVLKSRLKPICHRTLRRQVDAYVSFTARLPLLEKFDPDDSEEVLYELVSDYLQRDNLKALPSGQRSLMTLMLRKLMASSTFAIAGALTTIATRLQEELNSDSVDSAEQLSAALEDECEGFGQLEEEWNEDSTADAEKNLISANQKTAMEAEIAELKEFAQIAESIEENGKGRALLKVLDIAFKKTTDLGGAQKAIIFTEFRRTQDYLLKLLAETPWSDDILLFNGSNNDDKSKQIYKDWIDKHRGTDLVTGSQTADMRAALVDYFRNEGKVMIATEAGAEGINLQFCSLIVNYDLPWNPQRIEQRIGRCHRYGQKHDVVVVNFLNKKNAADKRVFDLLSQKFKLFEGVFGSSDEVLGAIGSGVDFEKRISQIYQSCRKPEEIEAAFDELRQELSVEIDETMTQTRQKVLENFDDEVRRTLNTRAVDSKNARDHFEQQLMDLTRHELKGRAEFLSGHGFRLQEGAASYLAESLGAQVGTDTIPSGLYELPRMSDEAYAYRLEHPLAKAVIEHAKAQRLEPVEIVFDYGAYAGKITILEPLIGQSGVLALSKLTVMALAQAEDYLLFAARTDEGEAIDADMAGKLMSLPGRVVRQSVEIDPAIAADLAELTRQQQRIENQSILERNAKFFEAEVEKLYAWADDLKVVIERDIKDFDRQIREAKRAATGALDLQAKLAGQKRVRELERSRNQKRRSLFEAQDEVDMRRDNIIEEMEQQLEQKSELERLFTIRWRVV